MGRRVRDGGMRVAAAAVLVAGLLGACSGGMPTPSATTPPTSGGSGFSTSSSSASPSTSASSTTPADRTIRITVTGKDVTPAPARVDLPVGQILTLVVTSDHDDQLHAHGFEVETDITAGTPATITLKGQDPGLFEVELHHPALTLLTVAVR